MIVWIGRGPQTAVCIVLFTQRRLDYNILSQVGEREVGEVCPFAKFALTSHRTPQLFPSHLPVFFPATDVPGNLDC